MNTQLIGRKYNGKKKINFVAFHVDITENTLKIAKNVAKNVESDENNQFLNMMFESVRKFNENHKLYLLTDKHTKFNTACDVNILRYDLDSNFPILSRSQSWFYFIHEYDNPTIFLDSDILILSDLSTIFDDNFDIGITYRNWDKWPVNAGIHFVNDINRDLSINFYKEWYDVFSDKYSYQSVWGGDQDAIHYMLKNINFNRKDEFYYNYKMYKLKLMHCDIYNYSSEMNEKMDIIPKNVKVMHFKGNRKKFMKNVWIKIR